MLIDFSYIIVPLLQKIEESGDLIYIKERAGRFEYGVIDALGHGKHAYEIAKIALDYLNEKGVTDPAADIVKINDLLRKSRGAVIGLGVINKLTSELKTSGVGNITTKILGRDSKKLIFHDGIVGYTIPTVKNQIVKVFPGDIILSYTDGIKENFDLLDLPDLSFKPTQKISSLLLDKFSKKNDDASILTIKVMYD